MNTLARVQNLTLREAFEARIHREVLAHVRPAKVGRRKGGRK